MTDEDRALTRARGIIRLHFDPEGVSVVSTGALAVDIAYFVRLYATEESNKALEEAEAKVNRIGNDSQALDDAIDCIRSLKKPLPPS